MVYAKEFMKTSETIIADVWKCHKDFVRKVMPPTAVFKCRSLVLFAIIAELMSLVFPQDINVALSKVLAKAKFTEFYCVCGQVSHTEKEFLEH